jgi:hypothetical protein
MAKETKVIAAGHNITLKSVVLKPNNAALLKHEKRAPIAYAIVSDVATLTQTKPTISLKLNLCFLIRRSTRNPPIRKSKKSSGFQKANKKLKSYLWFIILNI